MPVAGSTTGAGSSEPLGSLSHTIGVLRASVNGPSGEDAAATVMQNRSGPPAASRAA